MHIPIAIAGISASLAVDYFTAKDIATVQAHPYIALTAGLGGPALAGFMLYRSHPWIGALIGVAAAYAISPKLVTAFGGNPNDRFGQGSGAT